MKRELVMDYLHLHKKRCPAKVAAKPSSPRREGIPKRRRRPYRNCRRRPDGRPARTDNRVRMH